MKTDTKLALVRGALQRLHVQEMILTARRAIEDTIERVSSQPPRDIDRWSDQAEVAFYENAPCHRA